MFLFKRVSHEFHQDKVKTINDIKMKFTVLLNGRQNMNILATITNWLTSVGSDRICCKEVKNNCSLYDGLAELLTTLNKPVFER